MPAYSNRPYAPHGRTLRHLSDAIHDVRVDRADVVMMAIALLLAGGIVGSAAWSARGAHTPAVAQPLRQDEIVALPTPSSSPTAGSRRIDLITQDAAGVDSLASGLRIASGADVTILTGGGFSAERAPFSTVARQVEGTADLVVVVTPVSDAVARTIDLVKQVSNTVAAVNKAAPEATVLLVGPVAPKDQAATLQPVRDAVHSVAVIADIHWVDPTASGWVGPRVDAENEVTADGLKTVGARLGSEAKALLPDPE
jgi:hypothetical protein